jgi:hypothetical protein
MSENNQVRRIDLPDGDYAIPDEAFCQQELAGCTTRTAQAYDKLGLPYIKLRGEKWRPVKAGREWKKKQIVVREQPEPTRRRHSARSASVAA